MNLTVPDAARRVGRSPETIRRWIWSGRLPSQKVGNQHLVDVEALDALAGRPASDDPGPRASVGGEWGDWLRRAETLGNELRSRNLPPAAELVRASRRGR